MRRTTAAAAAVLAAITVLGPASPALGAAPQRDGADFGDISDQVEADVLAECGLVVEATTTGGVRYTGFARDRGLVEMYKWHYRWSITDGERVVRVHDVGPDQTVVRRDGSTVQVVLGRSALYTGVVGRTVLGPDGVTSTGRQLYTEEEGYWAGAVCRALTGP